MRIACLGWGSLIWDRTREFIIRSQWSNDGPSVCVEFSRLSKNHRVTLVVTPDASPVPVFWAEMKETTIEAARAALKRRECPNGLPSCIGTWSKNEDDPAGIVSLPTWATVHGFDAVIWTALAPHIPFARDESNPTVEEVIETLKRVNLNNDSAKDYIEKAPRQIQTAYRRKIEECFNWKCVADY